MRPSSALLLCTLPIHLATCAPANEAPAPGAPAGTLQNAVGECPACLTDADCAAGARCGQFSGDTFCAPDCSSAGCASDRACTEVNGAEGDVEHLCVPTTNVCGEAPGPSSDAKPCAHDVCATGAKLTSSCSPCVTKVCASDSYCCKTKWDAQCVGEVSSICGQSCSGTGSSSSSSTSSSTSSSSSSSTSSSSSSSSSGGTGGSVGGVTGGKLDTLRFAVVGDTRPANVDDTAGYPTAIITKIWQEVEARSPRPAFAVTTGDYMFATPGGGQASPQLDKYLAARAAFNNLAFAAMGNHECTGYTASNCGSGNTDGITDNYTVFLQKMLAPLGVSTPYYTLTVGSTSNAWTAKFVFVAGNAWDSAQASWFSAEMAKPTTYTFVVRHEGSNATTAPGVTPSGQIMKQHPYTLLLAGHTHTFSYSASTREVIIGNGGAPLTGGVNYGYLIGEQRADGAIVFNEYDYSTNQAVTTFVVKADGTPTQ